MASQNDSSSRRHVGYETDSSGIESRAQALLTLREVLEWRYEDLSDHGRAVGEYCALAAEELGLDEEAIEALRWAGALHDIGKATLEDAILRKPAPLTEREWSQVRRHPSTGADMLLMSNLDEIALWVLAHHERPDGSGYPHGISGTDIPLPARILAVADAYDAMRTKRVYKSAMSHAEAAVELRRLAGEQFDREVVEALLCALERLAIEAAA